MINEDFHKGERCIFSTEMCQEGYCSECIIFIDRVTELEESVEIGRETARRNTSRENNQQTIQR